MLRISKLTDYATVVMAVLAQDSGQRLPASAMAERTGLEMPTVAKVLKTLARAGLVESIRGAHGGYRLTDAPERIRVAAIIRAMEGPIALTECALEPGICHREHDCSLKGNWQRIGETVEAALEQLSLADLAAPRKPGLRIVNRTAASTVRIENHRS